MYDLFIMANLSKVIYINEVDYSTLLNGGTITKGGVTYSHDPTALYVIKNVSAPEYAETAGYATTAGQATKATQDGDGNVIKDTYEKEQQVIIEFNGNDTTFPNLTDPEVRALCNDNSKTVILKDTSLRSQSTEGFPLYYRTEFTTDHWAFSSTYVEAAGAGWLIRLCWDQNQEAIVREFSDTKLYPSENVDLGQAYGVSSDNKNSAARTSSISGFRLKEGGIVAIKFTTDIDITNPSLNISSTGSKPIYYRGSALPRGTVNAGDTVTFIYDGTYYHVISIDKDDIVDISDGTANDGEVVFTRRSGDTVTLNFNHTHSQYALASSLSAVATSGEYNDLLNKPTIPTETTVSGWGFTKNTGTITGITMNGASKGTSGVVNLGNVVTSLDGCVQSSSVTNIVMCQNQAAYDAISPKDSATLYLIAET